MEKETKLVCLGRALVILMYISFIVGFALVISSTYHREIVLGETIDFSSPLTPTEVLGVIGILVACIIGIGVGIANSILFRKSRQQVDQIWGL